MNTMNIYELPSERRQKALEIARRVTADPKRYAEFGGKRLNYDRNIVSVPLNGGSYRLLFRDLGPTMEFCGAATHAMYDTLINSRNGASIKAVEIMASAPKSEAAMPAAVPAAAPAEPKQKKHRNKRGVANARDWVRSRVAGTVFTTKNIAADFEISLVAARYVANDAVVAGWAELAGRDGNGIMFRRVDAVTAGALSAEPASVPPAHDQSRQQKEVAAMRDVGGNGDVARIAADIYNLVQELLGHMKPTPIESFSDDDLAMETLRRMARRGAV